MGTGSRAVVLVQTHHHRPCSSPPWRPESGVSLLYSLSNIKCLHMFITTNGPEGEGAPEAAAGVHGIT